MRFVASGTRLFADSLKFCPSSRRRPPAFRSSLHSPTFSCRASSQREARVDERNRQRCFPDHDRAEIFDRQRRVSHHHSDESSSLEQGSVLGPILFLIYTGDLIALVERHGFCPHLYADDSQVYGSCRPSAIADFQLRLSACIDDIASWMRANRLQLNTSKTDLLWCSTARRQHQLPSTALRVGDDFVRPSTSVRDLGIYLDVDLSMREHVQRTAAGCFATCASFAVSDGQSRRLFTRLWLSHWYLAVWTMGTQLWQESRASCVVISRRC